MAIIYSWVLDINVRIASFTLYTLVPPSFAGSQTTGERYHPSSSVPTLKRQLKRDPHAQD